MRPWPVPSEGDLDCAGAWRRAPAMLSAVLSAERVAVDPEPCAEDSGEAGYGPSSRAPEEGSSRGGDWSMRASGSALRRNTATPITPTLSGRPVRAAYEFWCSVKKNAAIRSWLLRQPLMS